MDRTLFTPPMIETFRQCRRAYQLAFLSERDPSSEKVRISSLCKRFLLRALAEINKGRVQNLPQIQKYLGQHWPTDKLSAADDINAQEKVIEAFRFVYRVLTNYVAAPYRPKGADVAAVNLKVRARLPHSKVYLEDTFDLILWHPEKRQLELVDFHISPLKPFDPAWPSASLLVRHFLADRLRQRWQFDRVTLTYCQVHANGLTPVSIELDESLVRVHWPELVKTINHMKSPEDFDPHRTELCRRCQFLSECMAMGEQPASNADQSYSLSA